MKRIVYQKLVRDHIPDVIAADGNRAVIKRVGKEETREYLTRS